ncbi:MAG: hypothetical protein QW228_03485 [Candidatus Aenigmatarchaeota archaeon]
MLGLYKTIWEIERLKRITPAERIIPFSAFEKMLFLYENYESFKKHILKLEKFFKDGSFLIFSQRNQKVNDKNFERNYDIALKLQDLGFDLGLYAGYYYTFSKTSQLCPETMKDARFLDMFGLDATEFKGCKEFIYLVFSQDFKDMNRLTKFLPDYDVRNYLLVSDKWAWFYALKDNTSEISSHIDIQDFKTIANSIYEKPKPIKKLKATLGNLSFYISLFLTFEKYFLNAHDLNFVFGFYAIRQDMLEIFFSNKNYSVEFLNNIGVIT